MSGPERPNCGCFLVFCGLCSVVSWDMEAGCHRQYAYCRGLWVGGLVGLLGRALGLLVCDGLLGGYYVACGLMWFYLVC